MQLIQDTSIEKKRGAFYTPPKIADFILKWSFNGSKDLDILEPSCGDGAFLKQIQLSKQTYNSILAIELDKTEAAKARTLELKDCKVKTAEFHSFCNSTDHRFDLVIGNPPFIRYQYFDKKQQQEASKIFDRANLKYSKLTNSWVSFIVGSSLLLKPQGKIAFVVPAEILQVSFAKTLRHFLANFYNKINIISFKELVFQNIQQEVVLLLCEKDNTLEHKIEHTEVHGIKELSELKINKLKTPHKNIDFHSNKWTSYFLSQKEIDFIEEIKNSEILKIGDLTKAQVGITTGANPFFTVPLATIEEYDLHQYAHPLVGRSAQISSAVFTHEDWKRNLKSKTRASLLVFPELSKIKNPKALEYIKKGVSEGIHTGYKCKIRDEWQIVPSLWVPDAFFLRRSSSYPKMLINEIGAYNTDTMHRLKINPDVNKNAFVASYYNSLTLAFTEICGRSHGGGVLELMPNELKNVIIPYHLGNEDLLEEIDHLLRRNKSIFEILHIMNEKILITQAKLSKGDVKIAHSIWEKLSERRHLRAKKKK